MMTTFEELKSKRHDKNALVQELQDAGAEVIGTKVKCFLHKDDHPSASIFQGDDGAWRFWCHVCNWGGDIIDIHKERNGTLMNTTTNSAPATSCKPMTLGEVRQWLNNKVGSIELEHPYRNTDGDEVMRMFRCKTSGGKDYRPARREGDGWVPKQLDKPWPLYQLDKISGADVVVICEGEKCCDALAEVRIVATTNPHGSNKAKHTDWSPLAGKKVILWPDPDQTGQEHMQDVGNLLSQLNPVPKIKTIDPDELQLTHKQDLWDFIDRLRIGGVKDLRLEVLKALGTARPFEVSAVTLDTTVRDGWPELIPLDSIDLPDWPCGVLPDPLGSYVQEVAHALHVPSGMAALCGLASVSLTAQGNYMVSPFPSWCEPVNLYTLNVAPPGTRKSQTHAAMTEPLVEYERGIQTAARSKVEQSQSERRVLEKKRCIIEKQLSEGTSSFDKLSHINDEIGQFQESYTPCLMTGNATPEQLAILLSQNGDRLGLFSAEPTPFNILTGLYTGGVPHLDVVLQAHSGDPIRIDRVGRGPVTIDRPCLTISLMCQPGVLEELRHKRLMVGSGLLARFLFCFSGYRRDNQDIHASIDPGIKQEYTDMLLRMLHTRPNQPIVLTFSPEARDRFLGFKNRIDALCCSDQVQGSGIQEWYAKLAGQTSRIAGLISLISKSNTCCTVISLHEVERAVTIAEFLIPHAKKTLACLGTDPDMRIAERISAWIKRSRVGEFTKRQLWQGLKGGTVDRVDTLTKPLQICCEHGIVRAMNHKRDHYEVNPAFFDSNP